MSKFEHCLSILQFLYLDEDTEMTKRFSRVSFNVIKRTAVCDPAAVPSSIS